MDLPASTPVAPATASDLPATGDLLAQTLREAEAQRDPRQRGDLLVRAALLAWDQGDAAQSARILDDARALQHVHPLVHRLLVAHALSNPTAPFLDHAEVSLHTTALSGGERATLLRELGEAWIFRARDARRGAAALKAALAAAADNEARDLLPQALALAGEWGELAQLQRSTTAGTASVVEMIEAAHVAGDRLGDAATAALLYARAEADPFALEHSVELAQARVPGTDLAAALRAKLDSHVLRPGPDRDALEVPPERNAITYLLAAELERQNRLDEAAALLAKLAADPTQITARLLMHDRRRIALARGAWDDAAQACRDLAHGQRAPLARAFLRRAAELYDARLGRADQAILLYGELHEVDPDDRLAARALERLRLQTGAFAQVARQLETDAARVPAVRPISLRRASAITESLLGDVEGALRLRRDATQAGDDLAAQVELLRLHRKLGDRPRMANAYRRLAALTSDERAAAAFRAVAGTADILGGRAREADEALRDAARAAPADIFARLALAALYRKLARWRELAEILDGVAQIAAHPAVRAASLRELGRITATRLGDPRGARAHLERALEASPNDAGLLEALADLAAEGGDWVAAVELRERAIVIASAAGDPARAAVLLVEIGEIEERQRKNDDAARAAYDRALELDKQSFTALRSLSALHRKHRRATDLLRTLRRELDLTTDEPRRLSLLLEIARTAESPSADARLVGDAGVALEAYRQVLASDPTSSPALAGLERICRRDGRWDLLADALRAAPRSPRNLKALAEALEKLERWAELAELRKLDIEGAADKTTAARAAVALAQLHEEKLGDVEDAMRSYRKAFELDPTDPRPLRPLARLYEAPGRERWPELVEVLEAELALTPATETQRRLALLSRIGELRRDRLDRPGEAASAFEGILDLDNQNPVALAALEALYQRLGREPDLMRILERKAELSEDPSARAEHFARIADLHEKKNDFDAALAGYREAFLADPANRHIFTALERLCYKRERWAEAMELYDGAIKLVESGKSRAYRLGDLYLRRGQVQLQYLQQPAQAAESYLRVLELDPDNDNALRFLESIYSSESDWPNLIKAYEKRADLTADDERRIDTLRRAARVGAAKLKETTEAVRLYERILAIDPGDREALDTLERYYEKGKDWNKLVSVLSSRLRAAPAGDAAVALLTRIANICEEGLRDEGRAIEHYRKILEIAPGSPAALDALGRIYESTEKWAEFIDVTRRLIRVTTDRNTKALLYFKCGSVMESKFGNEEDAIRYYDAAIKTASSCLPAVHGLRDLYLRRKDWQKVLTTLELEVKLWQDDKERAGVFAQIGHIYGDFLGDPDRALSYYENALSVDPDSLPANRAMFELCFAKEDWQRAAPLGQALAQKAMREGDPADRSEFYRKRGVVSVHTGDPRAAAESFIIALEIKPENLGALEELGKLMRSDPDTYDYSATYRELEKIYRKRDDAAPHLARVLVAQAGLIERSGDLEAAERVYREALMLSPSDFTVLSALVDLSCNMRRYPAAAETLHKFLETKPPPAREVRVMALLRLAEIHGDGEMDAARAVSTLREVLRVDPANQDALYRLAQELYISGRYPEARVAIERVIEVAAAPGSHPIAEALARYYYFLGRVLDAMNDARGAGLQFRRAAEYDPAYAPTALSLAKRAVAAGDRRTAEGTLVQAAHAAMEKGGPRAAVPLQRGLARILLAHGDRPNAIEAYRGILAIEPDSSDDRVSLAEVYALDEVPKAISELLKVLDRDLRHPPAYRLLSAIYERTGEQERALRVNSILEMLGYCDEAERLHNAQARGRHAFVPRRAALSEEIRQSLLLPPAGRSILTEVYHTVAADIAQLFLMPPPGTNLVPFQQLDDPAFRLAVTDNARIFGVEGVEVYIGDEVPGGMVTLQFPRPVVTLSRSLYARPDAERRFWLGRSFDSLRGSYAPLLRLGPRERHEVGVLLKSLLSPDHSRPQTAQEFVARLGKKTQKALERFVGLVVTPIDPDSWIQALASAQDRAGIVACDDFAAAARALAVLSGEDLAMTADGAVALGAVPGGTDLVRYFLSDDYHRLRTALAGTM